MARVVHFEFTAEDPQRALAFYKDALGWEVQRMEGPMDYWLLMTGPEGTPGIDGGVMPRTAESFPGTVNFIDVASLDEMVAKVTAAGGTILVPRTSVPGVGWLVYFTDTEGNILGMMETDESAA